MSTQSFTVTTTEPNVLHDCFIKAGIIPISVTNTTNTAIFIFNSGEDSLAIQSIIDAHNCEEISLYKYKVAKVELFNNICYSEMEQGFTSLAKGNESRVYGFDKDDQINLLCIMTSINIDKDYHIYWKPKDALLPELWTHEEFRLLYRDAMKHKASKCFKLFSINTEVMEAVSIEVIDALDWGTYTIENFDLWGEGHPPLPPKVDGGASV